MKGVWGQIFIPPIQPRPELILRYDQSVHRAPRPQRRRSLAEAFALCPRPKAEVEDYARSQRECAGGYTPLDSLQWIADSIELRLSQALAIKRSDPFVRSESKGRKLALEPSRQSRFPCARQAHDEMQRWRFHELLSPETETCTILVPDRTLVDERARNDILKRDAR